MHSFLQGPILRPEGRQVVHEVDDMLIATLPLPMQPQASYLPCAILLSILTDVSYVMTL